MASYDEETDLVDDEYDDLDGFIDDNDDDVVVGEEQQDEFEEEEEEQEEEEEEEEPPVGQVEILTLREQLKADIRRKNQAQQGAAAGRASCSSSVQPPVKDRRVALHCTAFGSFFGPSRPSLSRRVIEEGCSSIIKEKQNVPSKKSSVSFASEKQPIASGQQQKPKFVKEEKRKVDALRQNRDYSCLFSDDADTPQPTKEQPDNMPALPMKSDVGDNGSTHSDGKNSTVTSQTTTASKGSGLKGAPSIHNRVRSPGKEPHPNTKRMIASSAKNGSNLPAKKKIQRVQTSPNGQKVQQTLKSKRPQAMSPQSHGQQSLQSRKPKPSLNGQSSRQKVSAQLAQKQLAPSPRPKPSRPMSSSAVHNDHRKTRRLVKRKSKDECDEEEVDYSSIIRGIFKYDPEKFAGRDEDDRDMEANYASIQMEERRSARLARQEDDEQLRLIKDEERREQQERKRKKLAQKQ